VAVMLGEAMRDQNFAEEQEDQPPAPMAPAKEPLFDSLNIRFHLLLSQLLTRQVWRRAEFDSLARDLKLMPAGALDEVNDWAHELFNDPIIIEHGEEIHIQSHLVEGQS
jgi:hypothetical protein